MSEPTLHSDIRCACTDCPGGGWDYTTDDQKQWINSLGGVDLSLAWAYRCRSRCGCIQRLVYVVDPPPRRAEGMKP